MPVARLAAWRRRLACSRSCEETWIHEQACERDDRHPGADQEQREHVLKRVERKAAVSVVRRPARTSRRSHAPMSSRLAFAVKCATLSPSGSTTQMSKSQLIGTEEVVLARLALRSRCRFGTGTGRPYGSRIPSIPIAASGRGQLALLDELGVQPDCDHVQRGDRLRLHRALPVHVPLRAGERGEDPDDRDDDRDLDEREPAPTPHWSAYATGYHVPSPPTRSARSPRSPSQDEDLVPALAGVVEAQDVVPLPVPSDLELPELEHLQAAQATPSIKEVGRTSRKASACRDSWVFQMPSSSRTLGCGPHPNATAGSRDGPEGGPFGPVEALGERSDA